MSDYTLNLEYESAQELLIQMLTEDCRMFIKHPEDGSYSRLLHTLGVLEYHTTKDEFQCILNSINEMRDGVDEQS
jgi:hypothetical protein